MVEEIKDDRLTVKSIAVYKCQAVDQLVRQKDGGRDLS